MAKSDVGLNQNRKCPDCGLTVLYLNKNREVHEMILAVGSVGMECPHCHIEVFVGSSVKGVWYCATAEYVNNVRRGHGKVDNQEDDS